jgi:collagenase-like PrtC family protease
MTPMSDVSAAPAMPATERMALTVGPMLFYWPREALLHFYAGVADSPADTVVLGETVCSRRHEMKAEDWLSLGRDLKSAGKEVVLATQVLLESEADLRLVRRIGEQREFLVEAGDASALRVLAQTGAPFVLGPHINVYSRPALAEHAGWGAARWVAPVELSLDTIARVNPPADPVTAEGRPIATEVFAFGRMPLAFSARCFTARHHRLSKDQCEFRCRDDADGLLLSTTEGQPFLVLNGIQTMSAAQQCLIGERQALRAAGVSRLRLSPGSRGFGEAIGWFDRVMNQGADAREARAALDALSLPGGLANGYAHRAPGLETVEADA